MAVKARVRCAILKIEDPLVSIERCADIVEIEMDVYRIDIEGTGAAEAETLIDPEIVSVAERAAIGNERRTSVGVRKCVVVQKVKNELARALEATPANIIVAEMQAMTIPDASS